MVERVMIVDSQALRVIPSVAHAKVDSGEGLILDVVASATWRQMDRAVAGAIRIAPEEIPYRCHELPAPGR